MPRNQQELKEDETPATEEEDPTSPGVSEANPADGEENTPPEAPCSRRKKAPSKKAAASHRKPMEATSADGKWTAFIKDSNAYLRDKDSKETHSRPSARPPIHSLR